MHYIHVRRMKKGTFGLEHFIQISIERKHAANFTCSWQKQYIFGEAMVQTNVKNWCNTTCKFLGANEGASSLGEGNGALPPPLLLPPRTLAHRTKESILLTPVGDRGRMGWPPPRPTPSLSLNFLHLPPFTIHRHSRLLSLLRLSLSASLSLHVYLSFPLRPPNLISLTLLSLCLR